MLRKKHKIRTFRIQSTAKNNDKWTTKWCNEGCILVDVFLNIQSSLCSFPPLLPSSPFPPLPPLLLSSIYGSIKMQWVSFQKSPIHKFLVCVCLYVCEFGSSEQSAQKQKHLKQHLDVTNRGRCGVFDLQRFICGAVKDSSSHPAAADGTSTRRIIYIWKAFQVASVLTPHFCKTSHLTHPLLGGISLIWFNPDNRQNPAKES